MPIYTGRWHGKKRYFGLHYDLHAGLKALYLIERGCLHLTLLQQVAGQR